MISIKKTFGSIFKYGADNGTISEPEINILQILETEETIQLTEKIVKIITL